MRKRRQAGETHIEQLVQEMRSRELEAYRQIDNALLNLTEADREKLREAVFNATFMNAITQGKVNALRKGKRARDGRSAKAEAWHARAEELAQDLWNKRPNLRGNGLGTAREIHSDLKRDFAGAPSIAAVGRDLSKEFPRARKCAKLKKAR